MQKGASPNTPPTSSGSIPVIPGLTRNPSAALSASYAPKRGRPHIECGICRVFRRGMLFLLQVIIVGAGPPLQISVKIA